MGGHALCSKRLLWERLPLPIAADPKPGGPLNCTPSFSLLPGCLACCRHALGGAQRSLWRPCRPPAALLLCPVGGGSGGAGSGHSGLQRWHMQRQLHPQMLQRAPVHAPRALPCTVVHWQKPWRLVALVLTVPYLCCPSCLLPCSGERQQWMWMLRTPPWLSWRQGRRCRMRWRSERSSPCRQASCQPVAVSTNYM